MLADADVSARDDTSNHNDCMETDLFCGNCAELTPETDQPVPESPKRLSRAGSKQKEHVESKDILLFIQDHLTTCNSNNCLEELLTTEEIEDCDYARLVRNIKNSRRFVNTSFNDGGEKVGNTNLDYLRSLLRGELAFSPVLSDPVCCRKCSTY
jgi:hypothetical protein